MNADSHNGTSKPINDTGRPFDGTGRVVVIGGGLAGLTAAVTAARAGAEVVLVEGHSPGGRARTTLKPLGDAPDTVAVFNAGPRALYDGGAGRGVLRTLDIEPRGAAPPLQPAFVVAEGAPRRLPTGAASLLRSLVPSRRSLVGPAAVPRLARFLAALPATDPEPLSSISAADWVERLGLRRDATLMLRALIRLATYVPDLAALSADAAVSQLQLAVGESVLYLDGGWQQLVDGLAAAAATAGVSSVRGAARGLRRSGDRWSVTTDEGVIDAAAVVLAVGAPAAAAALSPAAIPADGLGEPVTAACLELAARPAGARLPQLVLGGDEPLYLARHNPPADLVHGPDADGVKVFHVLRYGARSAEEDRRQLWRHAALAGISRSHVVAERFLARMTVSGGIPRPGGGLSARPPVQLESAPGVYLAGDWVGPVGMLADAALSSGHHAGTLAAAGVLAPAAPARTRVLGPR